MIIQFKQLGLMMLLVLPFSIQATELLECDYSVKFLRYGSNEFIHPSTDVVIVDGDKFTAKHANTYHSPTLTLNQEGNWVSSDSSDDYQFTANHDYSSFLVYRENDEVMRWTNCRRLHSIDFENADFGTFPDNHLEKMTSYLLAHKEDIIDSIDVTEPKKEYFVEGEALTLGYASCANVYIKNPNGTRMNRRLTYWFLFRDGEIVLFSDLSLSDVLTKFHHADC